MEMKRTAIFLLIFVFLSANYLSACKHQKCPAYMTKEEIDAAHKASAKKFKKKAKKNDLF
jgi:hypothetical protein